MQWYEAEVRQLESRLRDVPPGRVAFYGSSSIRLWTTLESDFPDVASVNCGFGGSTMAACSWFFWRIVRPLAPSAVVLYAGDNDLGDGQAPAEIARQYGFLLAQLERACPGVPLAVLSIKPSPARWGLRERIQKANDLLRERTLARPRSKFVNVFDPMLEDDQPKRSFFADDGLHLSAEGYALWRGLLSLERSGIF